MPVHRRRQQGLGIVLLLYQIFQVIGINRIPPVTLSVLGLQVAVFLRLFALPWHKASQICVSTYKVWYKKEYLRLLYAAFEHGDDWHLYYNMVSFVWKGLTLERRFGSVKFLYILSVFTILTNITLVALGKIADKYFPYNNYGDECAVGFSGVIFALKVLTTHYDPNYTNHVMGIPIILPTKYVVWAELILIQLLIPNASFFGHLAGILVGIAYVYGPLRYVMDFVYSLVKTVVSPQPYRPRFEPRAEPSGYTNAYVPPGMSEEEQIRRAMDASLNDENRTFDYVPPDYPSSSSYTPHYSSFSTPQFSSTSTPHYPSTSTPNNGAPPPAGFVFEPHHNVNSPSPPPPGFSPDIEELRNRRQARFSHS